MPPEPEPAGAGQRRLARLMESAYLEVIPAPGLVERLAHIPRQSYVAITCSPAHGVEPTLALAEELRSLPDDQQLKLVPHVAARVVRDRVHLGDILARLSDLRVESVFVPGGDGKEAAGKYDCALDLLRDMAELGHDIEDVGIAAHPEGHPQASDSALLQALQDKQPFATYLVTQMCFDAEALIGWLRRIRSAGVSLPAWIGLPGVADLTKLISLSLRIGVGQSVRVLQRQKGLVRQLIGVQPYTPDPLLDALAPHLDDPELGIPGFHLFSFNAIERTERWRSDALARLGGPPGD